MSKTPANDKTHQVKPIGGQRSRQAAEKENGKESSKASGKKTDKAKDKAPPDSATPHAEPDSPPHERRTPVEATGSDTGTPRAVPMPPSTGIAGAKKG